MARTRGTPRHVARREVEPVTSTRAEAFTWAKDAGISEATLFSRRAEQYWRHIAEGIADPRVGPKKPDGAGQGEIRE